MLMSKIASGIIEMMCMNSAIMAYENRSILLNGLPKGRVALICRSHAPRADIEAIVNEAVDMGRITSSGNFAIVIVLENYRPFVQGLEAERELDDFVQRIGRVEQVAPAQPSNVPKRSIIVSITGLIGAVCVIAGGVAGYRAVYPGSALSQSTAAEGSRAGEENRVEQGDAIEKKDVGGVEGQTEMRAVENSQANAIHDDNDEQLVTASPEMPIPSPSMPQIVPYLPSKSLSLPNRSSEIVITRIDDLVSTIQSTLQDAAFQGEHCEGVIRRLKVGIERHEEITCVKISVGIEGTMRSVPSKGFDGSALIWLELKEQIAVALPSEIHVYVVGNSSVRIGGPESDLIKRELIDSIKLSISSIRWKPNGNGE